jgi:hypothetical protein
MIGEEGVVGGGGARGDGERERENEKGRGSRWPRQVSEREGRSGKVEFVFFFFFFSTGLNE